MAKSPFQIMNVEEANVAVSCLKYQMKFHRYGKIVIVNYSGDSAASVSAGDLGVVGTIPVGFRPASLCGTTTSSDTGSFVLRLIFNTNGSITGYNYSSAISSAKAARFPSTVYIAAD